MCLDAIACIVHAAGARELWWHTSSLVVVEPHVPALPRVRNAVGADVTALQHSLLRHAGTASVVDRENNSLLTPRTTRIQRS